ncbi:TetR/AcrR family transcriptional regulator [Geodermatophilus sp. CPCC 206100]|uniref:TetR/AcrR family transcriptional regulator n=1 Tax=Geodermatophilus sp. CPCC 206100 TaxID=3020054 RepID=UPI003AFF7D84
MTSPGLRERKKQDTRRALAEATLRLAVESGLSAVTVEQIAAAADVSYRTFFNHFSSKEEALLLPEGRDDGRFARRLAEQDPALPPLEAGRAALQEELATLEADRSAWQRRLAVIAAEPQLVPRLVELSSANEREMTRALAARTGLDAERELYPALLAAVLGCAVRVTLTHWCAADSRQPLTDLFSSALDAVAAGLPAPPPSSS